MQHLSPTHLCPRTYNRHLPMEAKVKGTLNYHGNLSDFPASQGDETLSWLMGSTWCERTVVVLGLLFCRCLHSLVPSTVVRRKKKNITWVKPAAGGRRASSKVSDRWSLLRKDKVILLTDLKETQLSNPQKYKFGFSQGRVRKKLRIWVKTPSILGVGFEHLQA